MSDAVEILLVEDNPVVMLGLAELLRNAGYRVTESASAGECLRRMGERVPDVVLLDVVLPDLDGVELCRRIKADSRLEGAFVVLLSSVQTAPDQQATGLDAGADGYIARPIENRELVARMHSMVRIQQAESGLRRSKAELERRVAERTEELSRTNAALRAEVAVREEGEAKQRRYAERLEIFRAIDQAILAVQAPKVIAEVSLRRIRQLLPFQQATVVELNAAGDRAIALATFNQGAVEGDSWALTEEQLRLSRTLQSGQMRRVRRTRNLFQVPDPAHHSFGKTWETLLDLPMLTKDKLIGALNLASDVPDGFNEEHREIAQEFAAQLAVMIQHARLLEEVYQGRERLRALTLRLVEVQEEERRALARELHDEIGQLLTGVKLGLELAMPKMQEEVRAEVVETKTLVDGLIDRVRRLSLDLRPPMLDDFGLVPAVEWHIRRYAKQCGIQVSFQHSPIAGRLPTKLETAAYRIVQEALTNIARHAGVTAASVRIWEAGGRLGVQVEDGGRGFDAERALAQGLSSGLSGMRERAVLLGGEFAIESAPGQGTQLTVEFPMDGTEERTALAKEKV